MPPVADSADPYAPFLRYEPASSDPPWAKTVTEGIVLPGRDELRRRLIQQDQIASQRQETLGWLQRVVRPQWLPADLPSRLHGVRAGVSGHDAFIAGWRQGGLEFRIAVTKLRIHVLVRPDSVDVASAPLRAPVAEPSLALAHRLLALPTEPNATDWALRPLAGLTYGNRHVAFARNWDDTLLFVTDGRAHKFSVMKYLDRTSPVERATALPGVEAWFPDPNKP